MFSSTLPCTRTTPWSLPALPRWLRPTQELRIDVQSPSATPQSDELESLYKRLHRRRDALFGASVLALPLPGLRVYCREADGEFYLYVEDVQAQCLAGYTVFNRLVGRHDNALTRVLSAPGMWLQNFTVNEPDDARRLQALDIDGIITDAVDRFAPSLA